MWLVTDRDQIAGRFFEPICVSLEHFITMFRQHAFLSQGGWGLFFSLRSLLSWFVQRDPSSVGCMCSSHLAQACGAVGSLPCSRAKGAPADKCCQLVDIRTAVYPAWG